MRSYKNCVGDSCIEGLANVPFHVGNLIDDCDDQVQNFNCLFICVLDYHACSHQTI